MLPTTPAGRGQRLAAAGLLVWACALQGHMWWLQRQESFRQSPLNADGATVSISVFGARRLHV